MKNKMSRQERREARLRQEKLRLQKKSKLTLVGYAVIRLIVIGVLIRSAFNGQIESVYTCLLTLVLLLLPSMRERQLEIRLPAFVILYSPVKLPQAISRCEASYHCPKDNFTRRQANITEAHFLPECASLAFAFFTDSP